MRGLARGLIETQDALEYLDEQRGFWVLVPAGFVSDGASVPRFGWPLLRVGWLELLPSGLLHDYLFRTGAVVLIGRKLAIREPVPGVLWANQVMAESMLTRRGPSVWDARKVELGLAIGGWRHWHRKPVDWRPA